MPQAPQFLHADFLADAALTADERAEWNAFRAHYSKLVTRLHALESQQTQEELDTPQLLDRLSFNREAARIIAYDDRYGGASSLVYFDFENLDLVKEVEISAIINQAVTSHIRNCDVFGRIAPNEFGLVLTRCPTHEAVKKAQAIIAHARNAIGEHLCTNTEIKVNFGVYTVSGNENVTAALKAAAATLTKASLHI